MRSATVARSAAAAIALALGASVAGAQQTRQAPPAPGAPKEFRLPERREFTLPNGLGVTLVQYGVTPKVDVELYIRAGRADESANEVWLGPLMGDLMEEGTTSRSAEQIASDAADMGGSVDVSVGTSETSVGGSVLGEFASRMVALIADVAMHPSFPDSELPRLKANRLRRLAIAKSQPQSIAEAAFSAALYPDQAYGRVFPAPEMLKGYTVRQIRAFYDANVSAARAHLYVVGRFDEAATERAVREAFSSWRAGTAKPPIVGRPTSIHEIHLLDRPGAVQTSLYIGLPVADPSSPDWIPLVVMNALLGGAFDSRITSNIRERKGYTYSPYSSVFAHYRDAYWAEIADVTTNVTGPSVKEILYEIDRLRDAPPSADELAGIQHYLAGTFVLQNSSREGIIGQLEFLRLHRLPPQFLMEHVKRIYAVTPADVQRMAKRYLDPARMTIVAVGDKHVIESQLAAYGKIVQ